MLQRKIIRPGEGARITTQVFRGGWRGYQGHTLIVRVPNSRSNTFRVADVVTEGIQGQPQLTFDSREAAIAWKESHPDYADWTIGRINREYMCIKIPLEDGSEAWLAESNFPEQGSEEWDRLVRLYPDYFRTGPGFFLEGINRNFTTDDEIEQIMTSNMSEEEKCKRLFNRTEERVLEYGKFSFISPYYSDCSSEKRTEAIRKCEHSKSVNGIRVSTLLVLGNISEPFNLTESYKFYVLGQYSEKYGRDSSSTYPDLNWWKYLKDVIEAWEEALGTEPHKLGFFTETLYQNNIRLNIEEGDQFTTNKSEVTYKLNKLGLPFWLGDYTKYEITKIRLVNGKLICCGNYWNLDEENDHVLWTGSWDESDDITVEDMEGQINIPGAILEFNGKKVAKQKLGFFNEDMNGTWDFYTEDYQEYHVQYNTIYKVNDQYDYRLVVKLPNSRRDTFEIGTSRSSITKFRDILFLTQQEALDWLEQHGINGRTLRNTSNSTAWTNLIKVPLSDGSVVYMSQYGLPEDPDDGGRHYFPAAGETEEWCRNFWEKARRIYPEYFSTHSLGFFHEELNLTESYTIPHETFKRVIIKYVKDNGYIKGGWNGRYMTSSPTVEDLNRLLRHTEDLTEYMCTPEEYTEFNTWVQNLVPNGPQADWMRNCINSWNKTGNLETQDLKNLVSFVSYHDSNIKFQRHQQEVAERERQHQEYVDSPANTWVGEIGDTIEFTVREAKISGYVNPPSYYAKSYPMWKIVDIDGHTYSWGDTKDSVQIEPGMIIKGKVKDHTEFRGIKQTKIWKIEISTAARLGFFKESLESDNCLINKTK